MRDRPPDTRPAPSPRYFHRKLPTHRQDSHPAARSPKQLAAVEGFGLKIQLIKDLVFGSWNFLLVLQTIEEGVYGVKQNANETFTLTFTGFDDEVDKL